MEIGGPSKYFEPNSIFPIYSIVRNLDCVNFSDNRLWEGEISSDQFLFCLKSKAGKQYIQDAVDLSEFNKCTFDFIISCNNLEHIANPIKAIKCWYELITVNGTLTVIVPNNLINFDHKRETTSFKHILEDYNSDIKENDLTHLDEILLMHDLNLDPAVDSFSNFKERCLNNFKNRAMHHHVFSKELLKEIFEYCNFRELDFEESTNDLFIIGVK